MNVSIREAMLKYGVNVRCLVSREEVNWWIDKFGNSTDLFPAGICRHLSKGIDYKHDFYLDKIDTYIEEASVSLLGRSDRALVYEAARSIGFQNSQISMDFLKVEKDFRGEGISIQLVKNAYTLASRLELLRLGVAAVDVGSYLWARMGFLATEESWRDGSCRDKILRAIEKVGNLSWRVRNDLYKIVGADDPTGLWDIADQQKLVNSIREENLMRPLGEVLLIESEATWRGTLEFFSEVEGEESPHLERLQNYLSSRR